jgi:nitrilase
VCQPTLFPEEPEFQSERVDYASVFTIAAAGAAVTEQRKLMPTYEVRPTWSPGDGHGLRTHRVGAFTPGALHCWENWMPVARQRAVRIRDEAASLSS